MTRIAVVGMGYWGKNLVRVFHKLGALHTVCDTVSSKKEEIEHEYPGVSFTSDMNRVLADTNIAAVVFATPAADHFRHAMAAFDAQKDVYVEKPLALTVADGRAMVEAAARTSRILMVGHVLRYHPAVRTLAKMVEAGELGEIRYVYSNRLNIGKIRTEENILWSFAPHDISVILALVGQYPERVSCHGSAYLNKGVPDVTMSNLEFPGGVRGHVFVSWLHPFKEQRLVVVGSRKMVVFDDTSTEKLVAYSHGVEWVNDVPTAIKAPRERIEVDDQEPLENECRHFLKCIEERTNPLTDGREALAVLEVLETCQDSLEKGGVPVTLGGTTQTGRAFFAHPTAIVDEPCSIGAGTRIWHYSHIMKNAVIGENCVFGQNCNVDSGVVVGNDVKVQNNTSLYTGLIVEDNVFLGPSCVFTNVTNPRSEISRRGLYEKTILRRGCTIGANATILCGTTIGRYAFVGAGAVVTKDVPDYGLVMGNPARFRGWISRHGLPLRNPDADGVYVCPESGLRYKEVAPGIIRCLDLDEEAPMPEEMRVGTKSYDAIVHPERSA